MTSSASAMPSAAPAVASTTSAAAVRALEVRRHAEQHQTQRAEQPRLAPDHGSLTLRSPCYRPYASVVDSDNNMYSSVVFLLFSVGEW
jgi:hypothetical protein